MSVLHTLAELKISIWDTFAIGSKRRYKERCRIISENRKTFAEVSQIKTCWWIKINTKAVRHHSLDGARFPHIIYFKYHFNGVDYQGRSCVSYYLRCPNIGDTITVFVDPQKPTQYAVELYSSEHDV